MKCVEFGIDHVFVVERRDTACRFSWVHSCPVFSMIYIFLRISRRWAKSCANSGVHANWQIPIIIIKRNNRIHGDCTLSVWMVLYSFNFLQNNARKVYCFLFFKVPSRPWAFSLQKKAVSSMAYRNFQQHQTLNVYPSSLRQHHPCDSNS